MEMRDTCQAKRHMPIDHWLGLPRINRQQLLRDYCRCSRARGYSRRVYCLTKSSMVGCTVIHVRNSLVLLIGEVMSVALALFLARHMKTLHLQHTDRKLHVSSASKLHSSRRLSELARKSLWHRVWYQNYLDTTKLLAQLRRGLRFELCPRRVVKVIEMIRLSPSRGISLYHNGNYGLHRWNLIDPGRAAKRDENQEYDDCPKEHGNLHHD